VDIDTLILEAERRDFLEQTWLDELVPGHTLRFTAPGGYTDVLRQIAHYQQVLTVVDEVETPYSQAVAAWYEMIYMTTTQLIEQAGVLNNFPQRTTADFFIWVIQHHQELEEHYSQTVMFEDAVKDIKKEYRSNRLGQFWQTFVGWFKGHSPH
jgi:hypothetical protein